MKEKEPSKNKQDDKPRGFDRGLEPDKIIGATDASGEQMFVMKWEHGVSLLLEKEKEKSKEQQPDMIIRKCKDVKENHYVKNKEKSSNKENIPTFAPPPGKKRKTEVGEKEPSKNKQDDKPKGFDRGLEPDKIIGATDASGELMFVMKWEHGVGLLLEKEKEKFKEQQPDMIIHKGKDGKENHYVKNIQKSSNKENIPTSAPAPGKKRKTEVGEKEPSKNKQDDKPKGFDRGLEPDKIIGATDASGELMFVMKWKGTDDPDLVSSKFANVRCPQVVIKFYEEHVAWETINQDDDDRH